MKRLSLFLAASLVALWAVPSFALSDQEKKQVFQSQETYTAQGSIAEVNKDDLKLNREGMPQAEFDMDKERTKITVNGAPASAEQLKPGMQVRTHFQIAGDSIVATSVEAMTSAGSQPSQQMPGSQQEQMPQE